MKGKMAWHKIIAVFCLTVLFCNGALADSLAGKWSGTLSAAGYSVSASVTFSSGGGYYISAGGISSSGSYSYSGSRITLSPSSPAGFSTTTMSLSLNGNRCTISGSVIGIHGKLSLSRRSSEGSGSNDDGQEGSPTSDSSFDAAAMLVKIKGKWVAEVQDRQYELQIYGDGWAGLYALNPKDPEGERSAIIEGLLEITEDQLTIQLPEFVEASGMSGAMLQPKTGKGPTANETVGGIVATLSVSGILVEYSYRKSSLQLLLNNEWVGMECVSLPDEDYEIHPMEWD